MSDKAYRLHISNFLTIEEFELDLTPGVIGFVGPNAVGKTNILTAVESILSGKHDLKLIKDGAKRSEIRLEEIEDGIVKSSVSRIQTERSNRLESNGLGPRTTPKKWLTKLLDEIAINPVRLIGEDPVKYLKQHLPVKAKPEEIMQVADMTLPFNIEQNAFTQCEDVAENIEVERRSQYQVMRHAKEVADEIRMHLPPKPEKPKRTLQDIEDEKVELRAKYMRVKEHNVARDELQNEVQDVGKSIERTKSEIEKNKQSLNLLENAKMDAEHELEQKIRQLKDAYAQKKNDIEQQKVRIQQRMEDYSESIDKERAAFEAKQKKLSEMPQMSFDEIEVQVQKLNQEKSDIERYEEIEKRYGQLSEKEQIWQQTKERYEDLDLGYKYYAYKLPKTLIDRANLPVEGLEFREEQLWVKDRHIDRLSSAERYLVAVDLAVALAERKGHLCVCIDGLECFSNENINTIINLIKDRGLKVIYTRVGKRQYDHEVEVIKDDNNKCIL